jgi:hypothetical protein
MVEQKREVVQRFVTATIEASTQYMTGQGIEEASALIKRDNPEMTDEKIAYARARRAGAGRMCRKFGRATPSRSVKETPGTTRSKKPFRIAGKPKDQVAKESTKASARSTRRMGSCRIAGSVQYHALYDMNRATEALCAALLAKVRREMARF